MNKSVWDAGLAWAALTAIDASSVAGGGASKRWDQVSEGLVWCGCFKIDQKTKRLHMIVVIPYDGRCPSRRYHLLSISRKGKAFQQNRDER